METAESFYGTATHTLSRAVRRIYLMQSREARTKAREGPEITIVGKDLNWMFSELGGLPWRE